MAEDLRGVEREEEEEEEEEDGLKEEEGEEEEGEGEEGEEEYFVSFDFLLFSVGLEGMSSNLIGDRFEVRECVRARVRRGECVDRERVFSFEMLRL